MKQKSSISRVARFSEEPLVESTIDGIKYYSGYFAKKLEFESNSKIDGLESVMRGLRAQATELLDSSLLELTNPDNGLDPKVVFQLSKLMHEFQQYVARKVNDSKWKPSPRFAHLPWRICPTSAFVHSRQRYRSIRDVHDSLIELGVTPFFVTLIYKDSSDELDILKCIKAFNHMNGKGKYDARSAFFEGVQKVIFRAELAPVGDGIYRHHIHAMIYPELDMDKDLLAHRIKKIWAYNLKCDGIVCPDNAVQIDILHQQRCEEHLLEWRKKIIGCPEDEKSDVDLRTILLHYTISNPFTKYAVKAYFGEKIDFNALWLGWFKLEVKLKMMNKGMRLRLLCSKGSFKLKRKAKPEEKFVDITKREVISLPNGCAPCDFPTSDDDRDRLADEYYERNMTGKQILEEDARWDAFWENRRSQLKSKPKAPLPPVA